MGMNGKTEKIIRMIRAEDIPAVLEIYRPYIESTVITFEYEVPGLPEFAERVSDTLRQFPWLICEINGQVAGYAYASSFHERSAYAWDCELSVYVGQEFGRSGIGSALYRALLPILRAQGYYQAYAVIAVPNEESQSFHHRFGFQPVGCHPKSGYKFNRWCDVEYQALVLHKFDTPERPPCSIRELPEEKIRSFCNAAAGAR